MLEVRSCARLAMKSSHHLGAPREVREQHLDRDVAAQLAIARAKHRRHAAFTDLLGEVVAPQRIAGANLTRTFGGISANREGGGTVGRARCTWIGRLRVGDGRVGIVETGSSGRWRLGIHATATSYSTG